MRSQRRRPKRRRINDWNECSSALQIKILRSACKARAWFNLIAAARSFATRLASRRSLVSCRSRFRTISLSWATARTDIRASQGGAKKGRRSYYLSIGTLRTFRRIGVRGRHRSGGRADYPKLFTLNGVKRCYFARSRLFGWMCRSFRHWTSYSGPGRFLNLQEFAKESTLGIFNGGQQRRFRRRQSDSSWSTREPDQGVCRNRTLPVRIDEPLVCRPVAQLV